MSEDFVVGRITQLSNTRVFDNVVNKKEKIQEILTKLTKNSKFNEMIWIAKEYSIADLVNDLKGLL